MKNECFKSTEAYYIGQREIQCFSVAVKQSLLHLDCSLQSAPITGFPSAPLVSMHICPSVLVCTQTYAHTWFQWLCIEPIIFIVRKLYFFSPNPTPTVNLKKPFCLFTFSFSGYLLIKPYKLFFFFFISFACIRLHIFSCMSVLFGNTLWHITQ